VLLNDVKPIWVDGKPCHAPPIAVSLLHCDTTAGIVNCCAHAAASNECLAVEHIAVHLHEWHQAQQAAATAAAAAAVSSVMTNDINMRTVQLTACLLLANTHGTWQNRLWQRDAPQPLSKPCLLAALLWQYSVPISSDIATE
jgi:hypothetical protein